MEYRRLGRSGLFVPALSFGTATFGGGTEFFRKWGATDVAQARAIVDLALDAGVNLFDTADVYSLGLAEEILGQAIAGRRERLLISTKASFRMGDGPNDLGATRHHLISACEASLRRLGTNHIDLWQLHGFDAMTPAEETLRTLDDLVRAGKVRYIGCSNYSGWHLMKALALSERHGWSRFVAHQAYYSLAGRDYEHELMPLALDQQVGAVVWSPLAGGLLSGKIGRGRPAPAGSRVASGASTRHTLSDDQLFQLTDALQAVADEIGRSVSQVALRWVMQRPTVATVVVGARDASQLRENLGAAQFELNAAQMKRLDDASARPLPYPYWHQQATFGARNPLPVSG